MMTFDELFSEHKLTADERTALVMHLATMRAQKTVAALQDCPHANPHRYCDTCPVSPCPIGMGPNAKVASNDQLGPNALAFARARVSLLGAAEHMDTMNRALDALEGLPGAALLGGWTFKGFTAWAQGLEDEVALLRANLDSMPSIEEFRGLEGR